MVERLTTNEKEWLHNILRSDGPRIAREAERDSCRGEGETHVYVCAGHAARFMRLAEQVLKLHEEQVEAGKEI